jgi:hypothetical protein
MKRILFILISSFLLYSCGSKKDLLSNATGKPGEVVVVIEKNLWNGAIGDVLKQDLAYNYPALPQEEPAFTLHPVPLSSFSDISKTNRNIICINLKSEINTPFIKISRDLWAKPQLIIEIYAATEGKMLEFLKKKSTALKDTLLQEERERLKQVYSKFREKSLTPSIQKFGIDITIPKGYRLNIDTTTFMWISSETPYMSMGLIIYSVPYTDTSIFNVKRLLSIRDSVLKRYIPEPLEGTYMTTEYNYPQTEKGFMLRNHFTYEIRGLWRVENDFMGGPFINLSTVVQNNKVVITEGYVYAPKDDKKPYVWQLESILYSLTHIK